MAPQRLHGPNHMTVANTKASTVLRKVTAVTTSTPWLQVARAATCAPPYIHAVYSAQQRLKTSLSAINTLRLWRVRQRVRLI